MKDELISEIYKSKESSSYHFFSESMKVQETYWNKFIEEFGKLLNQNSKEHEEEQKSFNKVKEMLESEIFQHLLGNDKYREKVDIIFSRDKLIIGRSNIQLLKIYQEISVLCDNYSKEYKRFITESEKRMRTDVIKFNADSKNIFESIFNTNVCRERFFNVLCNNKII